ncbi:MAG: carboxypeptidase regulatory-like domain-containing protein [Microthrixaceae bacterium]|nr:carboxypeptidase regulatory-like domain-containing protein [Microthrixaceae bacterium]
MVSTTRGAARTRGHHRRTVAALVLVIATVAVVTGSAAGTAGADANEAPGGPPVFRGLTAGAIQTCMIVVGNRVQCWGSNSQGLLGIGDTASRGDGPLEMGAFLPTVDLGTGRTAAALSTGTTHTCALLDNGTVKCWGAGGGQLGQGNTNSIGTVPSSMGDNLPAVSLGTGRTATAITAGNGFTCARLDNGTVKCWGSNSQGQLGQGSTTTLGDNAGEMGDNLPAVNLGTGRTATAISAGGGNQTCALLDNGTVKCWGAGDSGRLGLGDTVNRGDNAGEMGDNLPAVDLGTGRTATAISAGGTFTCALLDNGTVKCWGAGPALGQGNPDTIGDQANEMGDNLPAVDLGTGRTATAISAGTSHACARLDDSTVKCWGGNGAGQLGQGSTGSLGDQPNEMGDDLPAVDLGTGRTATAVTTGSGHSCARLDNGRIKCWGSNTTGALGQEDTATRGDGPGEMGDRLPPVFLLPAGKITGTVTDPVSGQPIPGALVAVLSTADFHLAGSAIADANGDFQTHASPGGYFLYLLDPSGNHDDGFFGAPLQVNVTNGSVATLPLTMPPQTGSFSGTVTDDATGIPLPSVQVYAIGATGLIGAATTTASGTYTVGDLPVGTYHAVFVDGVGRRLAEYWPDSPDFAGSDPFNVTASTDTPGIDATLLRP